MPMNRYLMLAIIFLLLLLCSAFLWITALGAILCTIYVALLAGCVFYSWRWPLLKRAGVYALLILGGIYLLLPALLPEDKSYQCTVCAENMKRICLALQTYRDVHHQMLPAYIADASGRPVHSWRVLILPYLGYNRLYKKYDFNEPWDGPNNRKLLDSCPLVFTCPSTEHTKADHQGLTSYVAITGNRTAWSKDVDPERLDDEATSTIILAETSAKIKWTEPRDIPLDTLKSANAPADCPRVSSYHGTFQRGMFCDYEAADTQDGAHIATVDGKVLFIQPEILKAARFPSFLGLGTFDEEEISELATESLPEAKYQMTIRWQSVLGFLLFISLACLLVGMAFYGSRLARSSPN